MATLTDAERQEILARRQATTQAPSSSSPGSFSPYPGLEVQGMTIGRNPSVRLGVKPEAKAASATIQRDFSRIASFEGSLNDMEKLSQSVSKGPIQGRYAKTGSKITGGGAFPGVSQEQSMNAITYNDMRPGIAAGLYRAVTGDDRISDLDAAQRALPFVPDLSLTPEAFEQRLRLIRKAIQRRKQSIQDARRLGIEPPSGDLSLLSDSTTEPDALAPDESAIVQRLLGAK